jgi:pimeloyl-ACP methyl ester carboxylesterase
MEDHSDHQAPTSARERLVAGIPVVERRLELTGISTAVLEGGEGPPLLLLHGPGANATHWMRVMPELVSTHRVVAPDLPGQGGSEVSDGRLDADRVLAWLGELIERTCASPPALVGYALGGAIAARFAAEQGDRLRAVVLVDTLGLVAFEPAPEFGRALHEFLAQPTQRTHEGLWRHCALDLDSLRERMDERWAPFAQYNVDRALDRGVQVALELLMQHFGAPAIDPAQLMRIAAPTALIWGRHDIATPLPVAVAASARYGWPLHIIEAAADDPPIEQPEAFLRVLHHVLATTTLAAR